MTDTWNPTQYDRFQREREQPFFDLLSLVRPAPGIRFEVGTIESFPGGRGAFDLVISNAASHWPRNSPAWSRFGRH